jgi:transposase
MIWLLRQGAGRPAESDAVEALLGTVRHRRQLVDARKKLQHRLHDQLNALCPGLSAPASQGRAQDLQSDIATADEQLEVLLAQTPGQILTSLPGVATVRAAAFSAFTLPIDRWPTPEHLYSATGLAPAAYQSSTITRRGKIARTGLAEHRDALMGIAWGLALYAPAFATRDAQLKARGMRPLQARVALARHACRLCWRLLQTQQPYDDRRYARARRAGGDGVTAMPHDGAN